MKTCPDCAEQVQSEARKCRYCGHRFTHVPDLSAPTPAVPSNRRPLKVALLTVFTLGVYCIWWLHDTRWQLNQFSRNPRDREKRVWPQSLLCLLPGGILLVQWDVWADINDMREQAGLDRFRNGWYTLANFLVYVAWPFTWAATQTRLNELYDLLRDDNVKQPTGLDGA